MSLKFKQYLRISLKHKFSFYLGAYLPSLKVTVFYQVLYILPETICEYPGVSICCVYHLLYILFLYMHVSYWINCAILCFFPFNTFWRYQHRVYSLILVAT